jgi:hypothetical protein
LAFHQPLRQAEGLLRLIESPLGVATCTPTKPLWAAGA